VRVGQSTRPKQKRHIKREHTKNNNHGKRQGVFAISQSIRSQMLEGGEETPGVIDGAILLVGQKTRLEYVDLRWYANVGGGAEKKEARPEVGGGLPGGGDGSQTVATPENKASFSNKIEGKETMRRGGFQKKKTRKGIRRSAPQEEDSVLKTVGQAAPKRVQRSDDGGNQEHWIAGDKDRTGPRRRTAARKLKAKKQLGFRGQGNDK